MVVETQCIEDKPGDQVTHQRRQAKAHRQQSGYQSGPKPVKVIHS
jgi:hypothetical protein